jgi:hypothetical protein
MVLVGKGNNIHPVHIFEEKKIGFLPVLWKAVSFLENLQPPVGVEVLLLQLLPGFNTHIAVLKG